jgi:hypothetical protein
MTRETLVAFMVSEARAEDAREGGKFDMECFGNFFPEYRSDAAEHGIQWDDDIWSEAYSAYLLARAA